MTGSQPTRRRGRSTAGAAIQTRAMIVEEAAAAFSVAGYVQTSLRDLAQRLGLSTGATYRHFRNKAELLGAVLNSEMEAQVEEPAPRAHTHDFAMPIRTPKAVRWPGRFDFTIRRLGVPALRIADGLGLA